MAPSAIPTFCAIRELLSDPEAVGVGVGVGAGVTELLAGCIGVGCTGEPDVCVVVSQ